MLLILSQYINTSADVSDPGIAQDTIGSASLIKDEEHVLPDSSVVRQDSGALVIRQVENLDQTDSIVAGQSSRVTDHQSDSTAVLDSLIPQPIVNTVRRKDTIAPFTTRIDQNRPKTVHVETADTTNLTTIDVKTDTLTVGHSLYESNRKGIELPATLHRSNGIFALLLFCFLIVAHVYNGGFSFVKENMLLVFSPERAGKTDSQYTTSEILYAYFLVFLAILLISISLYEGFERFAVFSGEHDKLPFVRIGIFAVLISVFVCFKLFLNKFIGYIFGQEIAAGVWNKMYLVLFSLLGLLCFLPTLILVYSNWWHGIIIGFSLFLFLVMQMILLFRLVVFFISHGYSILSLVMYLLTVEILPYIYLGLGLYYCYQIDIFNTI